MSTRELNLKPVASSSSSSRATAKPIPTSSLLAPWQFEYIPSPDGRDLNLLIMFHGLGDTKAAFAGLGKQLNLPSTAVLSLQAPDALPLMETPCWSWYNTFTPLFEPLPNPSPAKSLPKLRSLLSALTSPEVGWELPQINLFGWGQGGTMALELALNIGQAGLPSSASSSSSSNSSSSAPTSTATQTSLPAKRFASCTSICAGLISFPARELGLETPLLHFTRDDPRSASAKKVENGLKRAFKTVMTIRGQGSGEGMPRGKGEWEGIMRFWSEVLIREESWKGDGEVYEVVR